MAPKIMNSVLSMLIFILFGIQSVSHSQYYPQNNDEYSSSQPSSFFSTTTRNIPADTSQYPFNTRNLNPPYREYQHQHDQYRLNVPSSDGVTVKYYGTKRDDDDEDDYHDVAGQSPNSRRFPQQSSQRAPPQSSAAYRKLPGISRNPQFFPGNFDFGGVSISIGEGDGGMNFAIRDPSNEGTDFFRVRNRDRHPQKSTNGMRQRNDMRMMNDEANQRSLERPMDTLPTCNSNERISRQDGLCYTLGNNNKTCGHLMRFYSEHEGSAYGDCDCDFTDGYTARPIVYWKPTDSCYHLYQRGPCGYNEWLILDHRNRTRCSPRRCASLEDSEKTDEFWFLYQGKCYKTGQYYNIFCPHEDQEQWKVWFNYTVSPVCLEHRPTPFLRGLLGPLKDLPCVPGHKKMQNGDCKRIARFSRNDFNDY